jgi:hypothetical protein
MERVSQTFAVYWLRSTARSHHVSISERGKEIKRRRHRKKKLVVLNRKLQKATVSEKALIAEKIRNLTPGGEVILHNLKLTER